MISSFYIRSYIFLILPSLVYWSTESNKHRQLHEEENNEVTSNKYISNNKRCLWILKLQTLIFK